MHATEISAACFIAYTGLYSVMDASLASDHEEIWENNCVQSGNVCKSG